MTLPLLEPNHVDEPEQVGEYAEVLSRVASEHQAVIVRRGGTDLAAVVPLEYLELLQDVLARREAEQVAARLDWEHLLQTSPRRKTGSMANFADMRNRQAALGNRLVSRKNRAEQVTKADRPRE
jgi:hypothetical protein